MPYFVWEPVARAALRAIPRLQARQILIALNQYPVPRKVTSLQ